MEEAVVLVKRWYVRTRLNGDTSQKAICRLFIYFLDTFFSVKLGIQSGKVALDLTMKTHRGSRHSYTLP